MPSPLPPLHSPSTASAWTDERVELAVSTLLRAGVSIAAIVTVIGGLLYLWHHAGETTAYGTFGQVPDALRSLTGIVQRASTWHADAYIQLGVVLLIATPIARVAFSLFGFLKQHDRTYVVITTIVLLILVLSLSGWINLH